MALNLPFTKRLLKKADSETEAEGLDKLVHLNEGTRDDLRSSQAQFDVYATTVNQNLVSLKEFVKGDTEKGERLERLVKNLSNEDLVRTLEKIEGDEKVSVGATKDLLNAVKIMKEDISHMDAGVQLSMGDVVGEYKRQITNDNNSTEQQMKVLGGLLSVMSKEQRMLQAEIDIYSAQDKLDLEEDQLAKLVKQEEALKKLKTSQADLARFAKLDSVAYNEHSQEVERLLDEASDQTHRSRLLTSLTNVDNQLEQLGIDSKELANVTKKLEESQGEEIAGKKERGKFDDQKSTFKAGAVSYLMEGLGLGGIDQAFGLSEKVGEFSLGSLFGRKGKDGERGRQGGKRGGVKGLFDKARGAFSGGAIKDTEEYQGTRQALEDTGFGGRNQGGRQRDRDKKSRSGRRSRRSGRTGGKISRLVGGKFGRLAGGAASLLGLGGVTSMFGGDSVTETALDSADMAGQAKDLVTRRGAKKAATEGLSQAGKKATKGVGKKFLSKGATKLAGKGALQMGSKAAAVLGPAAAIAGAAYAGWEIGSFINKKLTEKTGRSDWLFAKLSDRREARMEADQAKQMREVYAPRFKKNLSPAAFELMGGDDNFDIKQFPVLRQSKEIVRPSEEGSKFKWVTSKESSNKTIGTIKKMQEVIEQDQTAVIKKVDTAQVDPLTDSDIIGEPEVIQRSLESGKNQVKADIEGAPDVLKDSTTRILEVEKGSKQILAGIAGNTAQSANVAIQPRPEGSATDRKLNINDSDLLFIRSVLLG